MIYVFTFTFDDQAAYGNRVISLQILPVKGYKTCLLSQG